MPTATVLSHRDIAHEFGHLEPWLADNDVSVTRIFREDEASLPAADLLVVLGSPHSVAEGYAEPAALREVEQVRAWIAADRPYLGICFGAQVLALAAGGSVRRLPHPFRGYLPIESVAQRATMPGPWPIWHNDAITAPAEAEVLGRLSHADLIFRVGRAWGVQPHVEVTADSLDRMGIALGAPGDIRRPLVDALRADEFASAQRTRALLDALARDALGWGASGS
jgi:GMP synthase-like glutamine amidotransferase